MPRGQPRFAVIGGTWMGVLTDFVVADPADASRVGNSACPSRDFAGMDAKGIETVKLGRLSANLAGEPYDRSFMGASALRYETSEDGPWVFELPPTFVHPLVGLDAEELRSAAISRPETEGFSPKYGRWSADIVQTLLEELAALCRRAAAEDKAVLMWMSL
jgi:hypothetical protein